ncbi:MAG: ABC transporter permease [Vicinamibacterales bacterium]
MPRDWRDSVGRDLAEETARDRRRGLRRDLWLAWHILRVGARFSHAPGNPQPPLHPIVRSWNLGPDVRLALRSVRREPASALAVVFTLALGTGAATATYAVVNYAMLRPVPGVMDEGRLISVYTQIDAATPHRGSVSHAHLEAMRHQTPALSGLAAWRSSELPLAVDPGEPPRMARLVTVTRGYFDVLGVRSRLGRLFTADEYESTGLDLLVISERLWRRRFNEDPAVIGRRVFVSGHAFEIIGVARAFQGLDRLDDHDGWLAYASKRTLDPSETRTTSQSAHSSMVGRLAPGASIEVAQAQLMAAFRSVGEQRIGESTFWPFAFAGLSDGIGVTRARLTAVFRVMLAGVALLLVLACANAANLMLARHLRRRPDLAVRSALGASRGRLMRELLVEASVLAAGSCALGLVIAAALTTLFRTSRLLSYLPVLEGLGLDWRAAAFGGAVSAATIALFALVPALLASRADVRTGMAAGGRSTTRHAGWLRTSLAGAQVALSFTLLVTAALLAQSVHRLQSIDFGFSPDAVLAFSFRPTRAGLDDAATATTMQRLHDRIASEPAIERVAFAFFSPLGGTLGSTVRLPGQDDAKALKIASHHVTGGYFAVLGIPVIQGRTFSAAESMVPHREGSPIILNEALARRLFGMEPAVGQTILTPRRTARGQTWLTRPVVGVVGNAVGSDVREGILPFAYEPFGRSRIATVMLRPRVPFDRAAAFARAAARDAAPAVPVDDIVPLRREADEQIAQERVLSRLSLVIGAIAALLALTGLYAVVAQFVTERMRELAIRAALGATRANITTAMLRRIAAVTAGGLAAGGLLITPLSGLVAAYLFGVSARDPLTITVAGTGLTAAAVLAVWPAIRRATRIDPAVALRAD